MLLDVALTWAGCCPMRGPENEASTDLLLHNGETNMVGDSVILITPSVSNYRSFDFFDAKFVHSSYSKKLYKYSQI